MNRHAHARERFGSFRQLEAEALEDVRLGVGTALLQSFQLQVIDVDSLAVSAPTYASLAINWGATSKPMGFS